MQWIAAREVVDSWTTTRYEIVTKHGGDRLGEVSWFGRWRTYVFCPDGETVYDQACLDDLAACLRGLMAERRAQRG